MIKELVTDETFLQLPAEEATIEDAEVAQDLRDTMASLKDGCACLAANQIGSRKAVIAFEAKGGVQVMFNPKIMQAIMPYEATESCLSLKRESDVTRYKLIIVSYDKIVNDKFVHCQKKYGDFTAEAIQHAIDHCEGKLV